VFYTAISSAQVILMQHAIEVDKVLHEMPLEKLNITSGDGK